MVPGERKTPFVCVSLSASDFTLFNNRLYWKAPTRYCLDNGGDLAVIRLSGENKFIWDVISAQPRKRYSRIEK